MAPRPSLRARLARWILALWGWRTVFEPLPGPKGVVVVYPHTSNWDFPVGYLFKVAVDLPVQWVGKDSLFRWPFGALFRWMGGIPVNRRESTGFVEQLRRELDRRERLWFVIAPEGTRRHVDHWKSGFWHLATAAHIPVGVGFIDFATRTVGIDRYLELSGDEERDLAALRAAYAGRVGRCPEKAGEIRFRRPGAGR